MRPHLDLNKRRNSTVILKQDKGWSVCCNHHESTVFNFHACNLLKQTGTGPRPVRTFVHLRGLPRLTWTERKKANWGVMTIFDRRFAKLCGKLTR